MGPAGGRGGAVRGMGMNWNQIEENWRQLSDKAREQWARLTDEDLDSVAGDREELAGKIQERYGRPRVDVRLEIDRWRQSL